MLIFHKVTLLHIFQFYTKKFRCTKKIWIPSAFVINDLVSVHIHIASQKMWIAFFMIKYSTLIIGTGWGKTITFKVYRFCRADYLIQIRICPQINKTAAVHKKINSSSFAHFFKRTESWPICNVKRIFSWL